VGYQRRSGRVSASARALTCSVAENTNRYLDDSAAHDPLATFNNTGDANSASVDYVPRGVPHPVSAVLRGIATEISPSLLAQIRLHDVYVTGISFDLDALHPSLLFTVFLGSTREQVLEARRTDPGVEYIEGMLKFFPATPEDPETRRILSDSQWNPCGQASLIRTLEIIRGTSRQKKIGYLEAVSYLHARADSP
jgi:hypothetical protein